MSEGNVNSRGGKEPLPELVDVRLAKALSNVVRQHILLAAVQGEVSPSDLSKALDEGLGQVSYHCKVLRDDSGGLIKRTRTAPVRGAIENFYRATAESLLPAKAWRGLRNGLRSVVGAGSASDLFNDLAHALQAGKLQGPDDYLTRNPLVLDPEGQRNVKAIAVRADREVEKEQRAASKRMSKANGNGSGEGAAACTFAILAFEAAWKPSDLSSRKATAPKTGKQKQRSRHGI